MNGSEEGAVGRVHLAKAMLHAGFVTSLDEAFEKYLADGRPAYMKKAKLSPREACDLVKQTGGIPVLAHPHLTGRDEWIPGFIEAGVEGIEAYYSFIGPAETQRYCQIARDNGLLITGGSDCHQADTKHLIGTVKLPYRFVRELSDFARNKRRK
jgi:predicted metal-dependent phosphoesterase TrpH